MPNLSRLQEPVYAALRVVAGAMFSCHGMQKILGLLGAHPATPMTQIWVGGVIELVCGALIAVGLFTRLAAFLASGTMAVAYFQFHFKGHWAGYNFLLIINHGELAVLYCFTFLLIACRGPGLLSVDRARGRA